MKKTHIVSLVMVAAAMVIIMVSLGGSSQYVNFEKAQEYPDEEYHVVGELMKDKPITYNPKENPNRFVFYMKDKEGNARKVVYNNGKPRDIERSDRLVIVGEMKNKETFQANKILMKCPSKYKNDKIVTNKKEAVNNNNEL